MNTNKENTVPILPFAIPGYVPQDGRATASPASYPGTYPMWMPQGQSPSPVPWSPHGPWMPHQHPTPRQTWPFPPNSPSGSSIEKPNADYMVDSMRRIYNNTDGSIEIERVKVQKRKSNIEPTAPETLASNNQYSNNVVPISPYPLNEKRPPPRKNKIKRKMEELASKSAPSASQIPIPQPWYPYMPYMPMYPPFPPPPFYYNYATWPGDSSISTQNVKPEMSSSSNKPFSVQNSSTPQLEFDNRSSLSDSQTNNYSNHYSGSATQTGFAPTESTSLGEYNREESIDRDGSSPAPSHSTNIFSSEEFTSNDIDKARQWMQDLHNNVNQNDGKTNNDSHITDSPKPPQRKSKLARNLSSPNSFQDTNEINMNSLGSNQPKSGLTAAFSDLRKSVQDFNLQVNSLENNNQLQSDNMTKNRSNQISITGNTNTIVDKKVDVKPVDSSLKVENNLKEKNIVNVSKDEIPSDDLNVSMDSVIPEHVSRVLEHAENFTNVNDTESDGRLSRASTASFHSTRPSTEEQMQNDDFLETQSPVKDEPDEKADKSSQNIDADAVDDAEDYGWILQKTGDAPELAPADGHISKDDERRNKWRAEVSLWRAKLVVSLCRGCGLENQDWATFQLLIFHPLSLDLKLSLLHAPRLCGSNSSIGAGLVRSALLHLTRYGEILLQPANNRPSGWKSIKVNSNQPWAPMKGSVEILRTLGYKPREDGVLRYPRRPTTETSIIARLTLDMLVLAEELRLYITGNHKYSTNISSLFFPNSNSTTGSPEPKQFIFQSTSSISISPDLRESNLLNRAESVASYGFVSAQSTTSIDQKFENSKSYFEPEASFNIPQIPPKLPRKTIVRTMDHHKIEPPIRLKRKGKRRPAPDPPVPNIPNSESEVIMLPIETPSPALVKTISLTPEIDSSDMNSLPDLSNVSTSSSSRQSGDTASIHSNSSGSITPVVSPIPQEFVEIGNREQKSSILQLNNIKPDNDQLIESEINSKMNVMSDPENLISSDIEQPIESKNKSKQNLISEQENSINLENIQSIGIVSKVDLEEPPPLNIPLIENKILSKELAAVDSISDITKENNTANNKDNPNKSDEHIYEEITEMRAQVAALRAKEDMQNYPNIENPPPLPPKARLILPSECGSKSSLSLTYPNMNWSIGSGRGSIRGGSTGAKRRKRRAPLPPDFMSNDFQNDGKCFSESCLVVNSNDSKMSVSASKEEISSRKYYDYNKVENEDDSLPQIESRDDKNQTEAIYDERLNPFYKEKDSDNENVENNIQIEKTPQKISNQGRNPFEEDLSPIGFIGKNPFYEDIEVVKGEVKILEIQENNQDGDKNESSRTSQIGTENQLPENIISEIERLKQRELRTPPPDPVEIRKSQENILQETSTVMPISKPELINEQSKNEIVEQQSDSRVVASNNQNEHERPIARLSLQRIEKLQSQLSFPPDSQDKTVNKTVLNNQNDSETVKITDNPDKPKNILRKILTNVMKSDIFISNDEIKEESCDTECDDFDSFQENGLIEKSNSSKELSEISDDKTRDINDTSLKEISKNQLECEDNGGIKSESMRFENENIAKFMAVPDIPEILEAITQDKTASDNLLEINQCDVSSNKEELKKSSSTQAESKILPEVQIKDLNETDSNTLVNDSIAKFAPIPDIPQILEPLEEKSKGENNSAEEIVIVNASLDEEGTKINKLREVICGNSVVTQNAVATDSTLNEIDHETIVKFTSIPDIPQIIETLINEDTDKVPQNISSINEQEIQIDNNVPKKAIPENKMLDEHTNKAPTPNTTLSNNEYLTKEITKQGDSLDVNKPQLIDQNSIQNSNECSLVSIPPLPDTNEPLSLLEDIPYIDVNEEKKIIADEKTQEDKSNPQYDIPEKPSDLALTLAPVVSPSKLLETAKLLRGPPKVPYIDESDIPPDDSPPLPPDEEFDQIFSNLTPPETPHSSPPPSPDFIDFPTITIGDSLPLNKDIILEETENELKEDVCKGTDSINENTPLKKTRPDSLLEDRYEIPEPPLDEKKNINQDENNSEKDNVPLKIPVINLPDEEDRYEIPEAVREDSNVRSKGSKSWCVSSFSDHKEALLGLRKSFVESCPLKPPRGRRSMGPPPRPPKTIPRSGSPPPLPPKSMISLKNIKKSFSTSSSPSSTLKSRSVASTPTFRSFAPTPVSSTGSATPSSTKSSKSRTLKVIKIKRRNKRTRSWPFMICDCMYVDCYEDVTIK